MISSIIKRESVYFCHSTPKPAPTFHPDTLTAQQVISRFKKQMEDERLKVVFRDSDHGMGLIPADLTNVVEYLANLAAK